MNKVKGSFNYFFLLFSPALYPSSTSYHSPPGPPAQFSPGSQRRERTQPKQPRPFSAEVGRLLSVQEGSSEDSDLSNKMKLKGCLFKDVNFLTEINTPSSTGHKRSRSNGSTSETSANLGVPLSGGRPGGSFSNLHRPPSHDDYYCEYCRLHVTTSYY